MNSKEQTMMQMGFSKNGDLYIVGGGNTYDIKDELKAKGFKFSYSFGWHSPIKREVPAPYQLFHFTFDELYQWEDMFQKAFPYPDTAQKIKNIIYINNERDSVASEYVGAEGERTIIPVTFVQMKTFPNYYIYTFNNDGNVITWITKKYVVFDKTQTYLLRCSIVKHLEINGIKTTKVNRCVIKNA